MAAYPSPLFAFELFDAPSAIDTMICSQGNSRYIWPCMHVFILIAYLLDA